MRNLLAVFILVLVFGATPAMAKTLEIEHACTYRTTSAQKHGAAFMDITNPTDETITIVNGSAEIAEYVELHTHIMEDGIMMMRKVEGFEIPAGETIKLEPTGNHVMLMNLKAPLELDTTFPLFLVFDNGKHQIIDVLVKDPSNMPCKKADPA